MPGEGRCHPVKVKIKPGLRIAEDSVIAVHAYKLAGGAGAAGRNGLALNSFPSHSEDGAVMLQFTSSHNEMMQVTGSIGSPLVSTLFGSQAVIVALQVR